MKPELISFSAMHHRLGSLLAAVTTGAFILAPAMQAPVLAAPASVQMPFPCGETWYASSYTGHSPSPYAVDWNLAGDDAGRSVMAGVAGTATVLPNNGGYGNMVEVNAGGGWKYRYAHLSSFSVSNGATVTAQTEIGKVGNTGTSTGPHLHYEQRYNNTVQPATFGGAAIAYTPSLPGNPYISNNCLPPAPAVQHSHGKTDFTHDGISDYTIYSGGTWAVRSGTGTNPYYAQGVQLGGPADTPFVADFNADGTPDFAIYSAGTWAVKSGLHPNPYLAQGIVFGGPGSTPIVGDFNNDSAADFAIFSGGQWAARSGTAPNSYIFQGVWLGSPSSTPMAGDIDGNGVTDIVIYENGVWAAKSGQSPYGYIAQGISLGGPGSMPLLADLDGDSRDDYIIYSTGTWAVRSALHPNPYLAQGVTLGGSGSAGLTGDFDANNRADYTIYSTGTWAVKSGISPNPYLQQGVQFGGTGSLAIVG